MAEKRRAGLFRYLTEAFKFRWNLLFLGGATAGALLSGHGDILLPLVGAAELTYLAGLTSLPRSAIKAVGIGTAAASASVLPAAPYAPIQSA